MPNSPDYIEPSDEAKKARKSRSLAIGLGLGGFVIFVFVITLARLGSSIPS